MEKAFEQVFAGIEGDTDDPGLFMLVTFKLHGTKGIFQKHRLKYVLGIRIAFQMDHAKPPDRVGISVNGSVYLLFAPHLVSLHPSPPQL